jgi:nucleoside-diphosphate-sugar epimerase
MALDLRDGDRCREVLGAMTEVTHIVYAALFELSGIVAGWRDPEHRTVNTAMFRNVVDPIIDARGALEHVTLLQGTKAYGVHLDVVPIPARERWPRHPHENFYFEQEDHLRARAGEGGRWSFTILRPQVVYGESLAGPMNLIPAIGCTAPSVGRGLPLSFPVVRRVSKRSMPTCSPAPSVGRAGPGRRGETFNVTNGDVFVWRHVWPTIADALGMDVGPDVPQRLADEMPARAAEWASIVRSRGLVAPERLEDMVGDGFVYADLLFGAGVDVTPFPVLVSTIKIRHAGFGDCVDTEDMFRRQFARLQALGLLPSR